MTNLFCTAVVSIIIFFNSFNENSSIKLQYNENELEWLNGSWEGIGFQYDINYKSNWSIKFKTNIDSNSFIIDYPSLNCSGKWELQSGDLNKATFKEQINEGNDKCISGGTVIITNIDENHISYTYFYPNEELIAFSTLTKVN